MDTELYYLFLFMFVVLTLLVFTNTYNIYRLTKIGHKEMTLMEMREFKDMHPLIKELYKEAVVNGVFYMQNMIVNDIIKMNDIDKWYNSNREDLLELIKLVKEIGKKNYEKNKKTHTHIPTNELSKLVSLNIPELISNIKDIESVGVLGRNESIQSAKNIYNKIKSKSYSVKNKYAII
tara:strand:+ start:1562 stop:2095 length:534 start_codon:yes stop_codon:yes gene_type:complete